MFPERKGDLPSKRYRMPIAILRIHEDHTIALTLKDGQFIEIPLTTGTPKLKYCLCYLMPNILGTWRPSGSERGERGGDCYCCYCFDTRFNMTIMSTILIRNFFFVVIRWQNLLTLMCPAGLDTALSSVVGRDSNQGGELCPCCKGG